jgi:ferredoxin
MAFIITDECVNCGACEPECPNTAIYEGGIEWNFAEGTSLTEVMFVDGVAVSAQKMNPPLSKDYYYIVSDKCTECVGFHEEPQCAAVCCVDCCIEDPDMKETKEELLEKQKKLHNESEDIEFIVKMNILK